MTDVPKIFLNFEGEAQPYTLESYRKRGGYKALQITLSKLSPCDVVEQVKLSGLRGRGGAGFPAGVKWGFLNKESAKPVYLCCNADEGEPGTFKDKVILVNNPHQLLEGIALTAYAIGAKRTYIYLRGEYYLAYQRISKAIEEAQKANYIGDRILGSSFNCPVDIVRGAGAYICGDETGLMTSIEGKRGLPRNKPPFPAVVGLYDCPTIINNVETLSTVPWIVENGGDAYKNIGTEKSTGTRLTSVSGHVNNPGVFEVPMGYPLEKLIYEDCKGIRGGRKVKGVIPGGTSTPILSAQDIEGLTMDYEALEAKGSMLGSGATIVIAEGACMVKCLQNICEFYHHESCGQCTPCREGLGWITKMVRRIEKGEGMPGDLDNILDLTRSIFGNTVCPLADGAVNPVRSFIEKYRGEFEAHITDKKCPLNGNLVVRNDR